LWAKTGVHDLHSLIGLGHREDRRGEEAPHLHDQLCQCLPALLEEGGEEGRTKAEVDDIILWLTGYNQKQLDQRLADSTDFEAFFAEAPKMNPSRALIKGLICGVRVEDIMEPTMREIRYLDKLIDELAKGRAMEKILRKA